MKHFILLKRFSFYMTDGANQVDNVQTIFKGTDNSIVRLIMREARLTKKSAVLSGNPVLSKLLGKILVEGSKKLSCT